MRKDWVIAIGALLAGCAPQPAVVYTAPAPVPLALLDPRISAECARIRQDIIDRQRSTAMDSIMASPIVQASEWLNTYNVITGLQQRAAIIGCI